MIDYDFVIPSSGADFTPVRIAVNPTTDEKAIWYVNLDGKVFQQGEKKDLEHYYWNERSGVLASDISISKDGHIFVIDKYGYFVYQWNGRYWKRIASFAGVYGKPVNLEVTNSRNPTPWVVTDRGRIYELYRYGFYRWGRWYYRYHWIYRNYNVYNGYDIGIEPDTGTAPAIFITAGKEYPQWGHHIFQYNRSPRYWSRIHGLADRVTVDKDGNPWVLNREGVIFRGYM